MAALLAARDVSRVSSIPRGEHTSDKQMINVTQFVFGTIQAIGSVLAPGAGGRTRFVRDGALRVGADRTMHGP